MSCTGLNSINPVCVASDAISSQASDAASTAFVHIAGFFGSAAAKATEWLWQEIDSATTLDLQSPALLKEMGATAAVAAVLCLGLFAIQVIRGALGGDPSALRRAVVGLGVSFLGSALALGATRALLGAVDALSAGFVQYTMGTNIAGLGAKLAAADLASVSNPAAVVLLALVILAAVFIVWAAMMIRKLMIIVAAVLSPFAFAGAAADISRAWVRRWIEFVAAMIVSKLLLVIILSVGITILEGAGAGNDGDDRLHHPADRRDSGPAHGRPGPVDRDQALHLRGGVAARRPPASRPSHHRRPNCDQRPAEGRRDQGQRPERAAHRLPVRAASSALLRQPRVGTRRLTSAAADPWVGTSTHQQRPHTSRAQQALTVPSRPPQPRVRPRHLPKDRQPHRKARPRAAHIGRPRTSRRPRRSGQPPRKPQR